MTISTTTLKNAARAIECDLWTDPDGANYLAKDGAILRRWEPETSSADSFELMIAHEMKLNNDGDYWTAISGEHLGWGSKVNDSESARMAIIQCAASIGAALCQ